MTYPRVLGWANGDACCGAGVHVAPAEEPLVHARFGVAVGAGAGGTADGVGIGSGVRLGSRSGDASPVTCTMRTSRGGSSPPVTIAAAVTPPTTPADTSAAAPIANLCPIFIETPHINTTIQHDRSMQHPTSHEHTQRQGRSDMNQSTIRIYAADNGADHFTAAALNRNLGNTMRVTLRGGGMVYGVLTAVEVSADGTTAQITLDTSQARQRPDIETTADLKTINAAEGH